MNFHCFILFLACIIVTKCDLNVKLNIGDTFNKDNFNKNGGELGCVMYGSVPMPGEPDIVIPIANNTAPQEVDSAGLELLKKLCPFLAGPSSSNDNKIRTCCTTEHLQSFEAQTSPLDSFILGCPGCKWAILSYGCNMICNPYQKNFVEVTETKVEKYVTLVSNVTYYLSTNYTERIFNSCKDYKTPTGDKFVQSALCISATDPSQCNSSAMIAGMTNYVNGVTLKNIIADKPPNSANIKPLFAWVPYCGEDSVINGIIVNRCSCKDCDSCSFNVSFPTAYIHYVVDNMTYWEFIFVLLACLFFLVMVIIGFVVFCPSKNQHNPISDTDNDSRSSILDVCQHSSLDNVDEPAERNQLMYQELVSDELEDAPVPVLSPYNPQNILNRIFGKIAYCLVHIAVNYSWLVIGVVTAICVAFSVCIPFFMTITSNPIDLWSSPGAPLYQQTKSFEANFGKFYRIEQIIISNKNNSEGITLEMIEYVDSIVGHLENITLSVNITDNNNKNTKPYNYTYEDFCVKPLYPTSNACVVYSIMQYFNNDRNKLLQLGDKWKDHLKKCFNSPSYVPADSNTELSCLPTFLQPIDPQLVVGDFVGVNYTGANTLVITFVMNNPLKKDPLDRILLWETEFINYAKSISHNNTHYNISFNSERSVEDEVAREAKYNVIIVLASYLVMFVYVSFSLGKISRSIKTFLIDSKFVLGFCGVFLVFLSVTSTIGLLSVIGVKLNSIALEVLPFLILAIGVDNMFIISQSYYRVIEKKEEFGLGIHREELDVNNCVTLSFLKTGPSIMISAISQIVIFGLGAISSVPVVRTFSIFASVALLVNFILQMTVFLSLFVLDARREMSGHLNFICCLQSKNTVVPHVGDPARYFMGPARWFVKNVLGKMLLNNKIRFSIVTLFITIWLLSLAAIPKVNIGLDQTLALPKDSYLQPYFKDLFKKLHFGAPVFFVIDSGFDYQNPVKQDQICSLFYCDMNSMTNYIDYWSKNSNISRIASPAMSWLDVYLQWLIVDRLGKSSCCSMVTKIENPEKYPNIKVGDYCEQSLSSNDSNITCGTCLTSSYSASKSRPDREEFAKFLPYFLNDVPNIESCVFGGKSAFEHSVFLNSTYYNNSISINKTDINPVVTSNFMTYHTPLITTDDFVDAIEKSIYMSKNITKLLGTHVYSYSVFYIFYETFLDIRNTCYKSLGICCAAIIVANLFLFGCNIRMTIIVSTTIIFMNVVNFAFLYIAHMAINPVSIVNLVMLFAINIEFVSHIAFSYMSCGGSTRLSNAYGALLTSGGSVFSGIALTKIIGVSVLAFASSELFKIYYFKMYMFAVVVGALHGLIFLPAILSFVGPAPLAPRRPLNE